MSVRKRWPRALLLGAALLAVPGCELTEVTAAEGEDVLVVDAVLRTDAVRQHLLLHRTLAGRTVRGEPGARVVVRPERGPAVEFEEVSLRDCTLSGGQVGRGEDTLRLEASCYATPLEAGPWVAPGERYELEIRPRDGGRLRGVTRAPGDFRIVGLARPAGAPDRELYCTLPPDTPLPLTWTSSAGTWAYLVEMNVHGLRQALARRGIPNAPDPLQLLGVSVSQADTTALVPAEIGVFDRFNQDQEVLRAIRNGFPEGVLVRITLAATDRNYVNSVRGGSFNPSGTVNISSIVGDGVGVFASVVPRSLTIEVTREAGDHPCLGG